jgi:hypothetical protein
VHEEQDDKRRLDDSDDERGDNIEIAEINKGEHDRQRRAQHERAENQVIRFFRYDVF